MDTVLVTGGTGFIGKHLCNQLKAKGYNVTILSRRKSNDSNSFYWNVTAGHIDQEAIINADYIIHLAGAGIADKRWSKKRKQLLFDSRVDSTNLLFQKVKKLHPKLKGFIAASGIGYYGTETSEKIFTENDEPGKDFLSYICKFWEKSSLQFNTLKMRTVILRTGVVFSKEGGALPKILKPIKFGFGAVLGNGNQYTPWIHIDDLCNMYIKVIENPNIEGVYNAVSPEYITNNELTYQIANRLNKKIYFPPIPSIFLKLFFGKMSNILLKGSRISCEKINGQNFKFIYKTLKETPFS